MNDASRRTAGGGAEEGARGARPSYKWAQGRPCREADGGDGVLMASNGRFRANTAGWGGISVGLIAFGRLRTSDGVSLLGGRGLRMGTRCAQKRLPDFVASAW